MKKGLVFGLLIVLTLFIVPAVSAQHDISLNGYMWFWNTKYDYEGTSYIVEGEIDLWPKITGRYLGTVGQFSEFDSSEPNIRLISSYLTLHYWFHKNINVNLGYVYRDWTLFAPEEWYGLALSGGGYKWKWPLISLDGLRIGAGGELELTESCKVFGDLGYVHDARLTHTVFWGSIIVPVEETEIELGDLRLGVSYRITPTLNLRGGYMLEKVTTPDNDYQRDGYFIGLGYNF